MGTLAGNLVNASPIGDLSIFFLALNADVFLIGVDGKKRSIPLREFFVDYKKLAKRKDELIEKIRFRIPEKKTFFNFEKVSKRQFLDIASVNSAVSFKLKDNIFKEVHLSAGGVGPVPLYLGKTVAFLEGKEASLKTLLDANSVLQKEIAPISDVRGSADYKRLLLRQLFFAHFNELIPEKINQAEFIHSLQH
jgi:xanthine dehydrogenase small subunit